MPSLTPEAEQKPDKPDTDTRCPQSGKKLRMKVGRGAAGLDGMRRVGGRPLAVRHLCLA